MTASSPLHRFLADAKHVRLTEREKAEGRAALLARIALQDAVSISLSADEKAMGRDALVASMRLQSEKQADAPHWLHSLLAFPLLRMPALALSALIIVLGGGAVAYAAESAIPGDPLYTLKVGVFEPLREKVIRTPEKRAAWQIKKIERRLGEARALAAAKRLTPEYRQAIERRISEQVVILKDALVPSPSLETHVAAQEVLAVTFEKYEQSATAVLVASGAVEVTSDMSFAAFEGAKEAKHETEIEAEHLLQFVKEGRAAAQGEVDFIVQTAIGNAGSSVSTDASTDLDVTVTGKRPAKKQRSEPSSEGTALDDTEEDLPLIQRREKRSSSSDASSVSSVVSSALTEGSLPSAAIQVDTEVETEAAGGELREESAASVEASSSSERAKELLKKVEKKKALIEEQLRGL